MKKHRATHNKPYTWLLSIPVACAVLTVMGHGYEYTVAMQIACAILVGFFSGKQMKWSKWLIVAAFLLSIAGDWMLRHRAGVPVRFIYGIALYFATHVGYLTFCLLHGKMQWRFLLVSAAGYGLFFFFGLRPAIDDPALSVSVLLYTLTSCVSLAATPGLRLSAVSRWLFFSGVACMVFSDTLIACCEFLHVCRLNPYLMLPTYYASQLFVTAAIMIHRRK